MPMSPMIVVLMVVMINAPACDSSTVVLDPPVKTEISARLSDWDNGTCLALGDTDQYAFDASTGRWFPQPQNKCWLSGLLITKCVPDDLETPFIVRITGHHLVCSTSHFKVMMRQKKGAACEHDGEYNICQWSDVTVSGGLTTCIAVCRCQGDDCKHVTLHIPKRYDGWKICEIEIK